MDSWYSVATNVPLLVSDFRGGEINHTMAFAFTGHDDISITDVRDSDATDTQMEFEYFASDDEGLRILGSAGEALTRVDLNLAYSSEKFLNLDILLMHVADRAGDLESLVIDDDEFVSGDSAEKVLEFDILSGILHSEVKELDNFMICLQEEIMDACDKISSCEHLKEAFAEMEENLHDSEESLKQLQSQVAEMRMQSSKFHNTVVFGGLESWNSGISEISHLSPMPAKMKMQTTEQQRHILKMLEKSLARELDLEKWLSESRHNEEELKLKLHCREQEMEESTDLFLERVFQAESFSEVLTSISKEMTGKLQTVQSNLYSLIKREDEMKAKLQDRMDKHSTENMEFDHVKANLKKAEDEYNLANSEATTLREKVLSLEEKLRESDTQLQEAKASHESSRVQHNMLDPKIIDLEKMIEDLRENVLKMRNRAENAETLCNSLAEANLKFEEKHTISSRETEKVSSLEKQLEQSESQLQQAQATIEASQENQNMLYSTLKDMENLIEDLKAKSLKAEDSAESAEAKCILLTETNLELQEELGFLQGRVECLETALRQADDMKMAVAEDIGLRTKVISDLVVKLALERERLHTKISSLTNENNILVEKLGKTRNVTVSRNGNSSKKESAFLNNNSATSQSLKSFDELVPDPSTTTPQVDKSAKEAEAGLTCETEVGPTASGTESTLGLMRKLVARRLNSKYVFMAVFILLISVAVSYLFQQESSPF
ncbi:WPP domain-containing protein [Cinnamomum micranthum f. kanehirae]|uniref:WPP domain-containing protein n=1 Tax=Cinnamomum micranthum f. kanehirae TaxID=337451 RepID=A0A443N7J5_9MAGN|nr:WPP domain-containing protein [Cinnamomum micranthum f. kanehirae]